MPELDLPTSSLISTWRGFAKDEVVRYSEKALAYEEPSFIMDALKGRFDPYIEDRRSDSVFSTWTAAIAANAFGRSEANFKEVLVSVSKDFGAWLENCGPIPNENKDKVLKFISGVGSPHMFISKEDVPTNVKNLLREVYKAPLFNQEYVRYELLRVAVSCNFLDLTEELLKDGLNVNKSYTNQDVVYITQLEISYNGSNNSVGVSRPLGFFVRSPQMFSLLNQYSCDWNAKDIEGVSLIDNLKALSSSHFNSVKARDEVLKKVGEIQIKEREKDPQTFVWEAINIAQNLTDISRAFSGINQYELKAANGENVFHALALGYLPAVKKYATSKKSGHLLWEETNEGLLPIEYAVLNRSDIFKRTMPFWKESFSNFVQSGGRKLSWLNVMSKAVDLGINNSAATESPYENRWNSVVQAFPSRWWDAETFEERLSLIKTEVGTSFVSKLKDRAYKDGLKISMFNQVFNFTDNPRSLKEIEIYIDKSSSKDELALLYMDYLASVRFSQVGSYSPRSASIQEEKLFNTIVTKCLENEVDLPKINEEFLSGERKFSASGPDNFKTFYKIFGIMDSISSEFERRKLIKKFSPELSKNNLLKGAL